MNFKQTIWATKAHSGKLQRTTLPYYERDGKRKNQKRCIGECYKVQRTEKKTRYSKRFDNEKLAMASLPEPAKTMYINGYHPKEVVIL